jgi:hypothetical protein
LVQAWDARVIKKNPVDYQLRSVSYNGVQSAGATLSDVGFNVFYNSTFKCYPTIISVLFNGENVCATDSGIK